MRIYKPSDRIKIKIGDEQEGVILTLSPMTRIQKQEIQSLLSESLKNEQKATDAVILALKYAVKNIEGVEGEDGTPYKTEFDSGMLADSSVDDLMNLPDAAKIMIVATTWTNGVPRMFKDFKGNPLEGVEIISEKKTIAPTN